MRVTSGLWVSAYLRRAAAEGCFTSVGKRGAEEAGAIFVIVNHLDNKFSLYGPAPQTAFDDDTGSDRKFSLLIDRENEQLVLEKLEREKKFDPDLWVIENEDRQGRALLEIASEN